MTVETPTYLDYNATAPVRPEVVDAMARVMGEVGNPSSVHQAGRGARAHVEEARAEVAALAGVSPKAVIFTSGGTEANNLAIRGVTSDTLTVSAVEHDAVLAPAQSAGKPCHVLGVDDRGMPDLAALEGLLADLERQGHRTLVSVMLVNNETGVILPVREIARLAHAHGALVHTDAVQAAGKIALDFKDLGVDLMTLSAHKMGGPQGVGALLIRDGLPLLPMVQGGGQELRRRSGTENVPAIVGFGVAARLARDGIGDMDRVGALRDRLEAGVRDAVPAAVIFGAASPRVPTTSSIAVAGAAAETQVMGLDLEGISVSAGSACSSGKVTPSHVLAAMGADAELARAAIRVSLGWASTAADVDRFLDTWPRVVGRLKTSRRAS